MKKYFKHISAVVILAALFVLASEGLHHHDEVSEENHCDVCLLIKNFTAADTPKTHTGHFIPLKGFNIDTLQQVQPSGELQNQNSGRAPPFRFSYLVKFIN